MRDSGTTARFTSKFLDGMGESLFTGKWYCASMHIFKEFPKFFGKILDKYLKVSSYKIG